jgi:phenylpropionate dioxygenase-like ring-hydroxylating dioxygenase large terminal subunit
MTETIAPPAPASPARTSRDSSLGRLDWSTWPRYQDAVLGFREYWYPICWSRDVGKRPRAVQVLGESIMLKRDRGRVYALHDRCPHRGVPLSHPLASQEFPGTWSCCYHGWTYDLASGRLVAVITDGPDSPIAGKVSVKTYPVEERAGLVWVFIGDGDPPPVESDIPAEMLDPDAVVLGRITDRPGNWRFAAENGFDDGHAKYLHRKSLWTWRRSMPTWTLMHIEELDDGWIARAMDKVEYKTTFPGLGVWPPHPSPLRKRGKGGPQTSIRLPAMLRVSYPNFTHYEWWVGSGPESHTYIQLAVKRATGRERLRFRLFYQFWAGWAFHGLFNDEDALMVDVMDAPPERLYRPDSSLTAWRVHCEKNARGPAQATTRDLEVAARMGERNAGPGLAQPSMPITHRIRHFLGI